MIDSPSDVKSIFGHALDLQSPAERAKYLDKACNGNIALRAEVEDLIGATARAGNFLTPVLPGEQPRFGGSTAGMGDLIGPYKLLEQIGEGGMGLVYMAEQQRPVRRMVALKIIKPGMDSKQVIARFEAERQALAMMDHVNIAKVLDAGTTEADRPYFVMELVKGVPITKYCDEKRLTINQRLDLFVQVCQAIGHAHQKGMIHRDIKPSNVLIAQYDDAPVPKVIDFGVAKATAQKLTEKTMFTGFGQLIGTLDYMSPEQAQFNQLDIDTRSDIYSLGVLLYELLTGSTPFEQARLRTVAFDETLRIIREEEPPKPSTRLSAADTLPTIAANRNLEPARLRKAVRGELDWIVMKCLEKDRNRRYQSASGLASDIGRYLHDEPVQACPPSAVYRLKKFLSRNKGSLAVAVGMLLAVTAIAATVGWAMRDRATRESEIERAKIDQRAIVERQIRDSMSTTRALVAENKLAAARETLAQARAQLSATGVALPDLSAELEADQSELMQFQQLLDLIDRAHQSVTGPVQEPDLSDDEMEADEGEEPPAPAPAPIQIVQHRPAAAVPFLLDALTRFDVLSRDSGDSQREGRLLSERQIEQSRRVAYEVLLWLADDSVLRRQDHHSQAALSAQAAAQQALNYLSKAAAIYRPTNALFVLRAACHKALQDNESEEKDAQSASQTPPTIAIDHFLRGMAAFNDGKPAEGVAAFEAAIRLEPTHYWSLLKLADCLAHSTQKSAQWAEAVRVYTGCILNRPDHAYAHYRRGTTFYDLRRYQEALADCSQAIELDPTYMRAWYYRGYVYRALNGPEKALADFTQAIALDPAYAPGWRARGYTYDKLSQLEKALADFSQAISLEPDLVTGWRARASAYEKLGQKEHALADLTRAIELQPTNAYAWNTRAYAYSKMNQPRKAIADYSKAIELNPKSAHAWHGRGHAHFRLGQWAKVIDDLAMTLELNPKNARAWTCRGAAHRHLGQRQEALAAWSKAVEIDPKNTTAWNSRAILYIGLGQPDNALADFTKAIELSPKAAVYWSNRAKFHHRILDQPEKSISDYEKAIEVGPSELTGHNDLAWLLATYPDPKVRSPERAVELAEKAVQLSPKSGSAWNTLGVARYRAGDWQSAASALARSMELRGGGSATDHFFLAMCHAKLGDDGAGRAAYEMGIAWVEKNKARLKDDTETAEELRRFQAEAEEVLGELPPD